MTTDLITPVSQNLVRKAVSAVTFLFREANVFRLCIAALILSVFTLASATGFVATQQDSASEPDSRFNRLFKRAAIFGGTATLGLAARAAYLAIEH